uniref:Jasmintide 11 n=1 Tax=Jasminum sambac TaxID=660624 RepID=A0A2K9QL71_9LAMI|nr:jasmintide 11 precursor [Jasminum sambac]
MEKTSIKFTFLTLFLIAIAVAVVPVPKVEATEPQQTLRIVPVVVKVEAKEPPQTLSRPVAETEAKELQQSPLSAQPNGPCLYCHSDANCDIWPWTHCRDECCHMF